jgi:NAD(P)-dependent dehydrogenase (short-subunit alcohol dehydrogenase family)
VEQFVLKRLQGKVAIVTGGGSGIGRALCLELAHQGASAVVVDINEEQVARTVDQIVQAGGSASAYPLDVSDSTGLDRLVRDTVDRHRRIDFMFNNAGIGWSGDYQAMNPADIDRIVKTNLQAVLLGSLAVYPTMIEQGFGHIVNTASSTALLPTPGSALYSATKHGVLGFSSALREEARLYGVRVSVVCPGFVKTNLTSNSASILRARPESHAEPTASKRFGAAKFARALLKSVLRNTAIIVPHTDIRFGWRLYRVSPWLYTRVVLPVVMRKLHPEKKSGFEAVYVSSLSWLFRTLGSVVGRG